MRITIIVVLLFGLVAAITPALACTCSNNCGTYSEHSSTVESRTWCMACNTNCTPAYPACAQGCGTPGYYYTWTKTTTTTYDWTGCEGTGETNCSGYEYEQGLIKEVKTWTYACGNEACCQFGPFCMPWVHQTHYDYTPTYDWVKCVCPGGGG